MKTPIKKPLVSAIAKLAHDCVKADAGFAARLVEIVSLNPTAEVFDGARAEFVQVSALDFVDRYAQLNRYTVTIGDSEAGKVRTTAINTAVDKDKAIGKDAAQCAHIAAAAVEARNKDETAKMRLSKGKDAAIALWYKLNALAGIVPPRSKNSVNTQAAQTGTSAADKRAAKGEKTERKARAKSEVQVNGAAIKTAVDNMVKTKDAQPLAALVRHWADVCKYAISLEVKAAKAARAAKK